MPVTQDTPAIDALRRLAVATAAYALAIGLVAAALPAILTPLPVEGLLPEPLPVVARVPVAPPASGPAPSLTEIRS